MRFLYGLQFQQQTIDFSLFAALLPLSNPEQLLCRTVPSEHMHPATELVLGGDGPAPGGVLFAVYPQMVSLWHGSD